MTSVTNAPFTATHKSELTGSSGSPYPLVLYIAFYYYYIYSTHIAAHMPLPSMADEHPGAAVVVAAHRTTPTAWNMPNIETELTVVIAQLPTAWNLPHIKAKLI